jgi:hypothetical protein
MSPKMMPRRGNDILSLLNYFLAIVYNSGFEDIIRKSKILTIQDYDIMSMQDVSSKRAQNYI